MIQYNLITIKPESNSKILVILKDMEKITNNKYEEILCYVDEKGRIFTQIMKTEVPDDDILTWCYRK